MPATKTRGEPAIKESLHYSALQDWMWDGSLSRLAVCQQYLERDIAPVCGWSRTAAALSLISRKWPEDSLTLTSDLFDAYVARGMISLAVPIEDHSVSGALDYHGKQLLHAAFIARNVEAAIALLRHGALELTDFPAIHPRLAKHGADRAAALMNLVEETWPDLHHVQARFIGFVMARTIKSCMGDNPTHPVAAAGRRMKDV